jgi:hypothetical protein
MAYSREVADFVLDQMADGISLREICRVGREANPMFPAPGTVRGWAVQDIDGMAERYARARKAQADHWADEILEITDDATNDWVERVNARTGKTEIKLDHEHVQRSALRADARKWLLAKLHPEVFADRLAHQTLGKDGKPVDPTKHTFAVEDTRAPIDELISGALAKVEQKETRH